ncbi:MAG: DUF1573 domain-containing protein [Planctomycetaceae bacterium]|nr:DUF1573 domain-containing protein [Planctomycetaceae bacterium]
MRVGVVVVGLLTFLALVFGVVWFVRDRPLVRAELLAQTADESPFVIAKTGPQPKAVFERTEFKFGIKESGDEGTIEFEIRNEGDAPLKMQMGNANCLCTVSNLDRNPIDPGRSAVVKLTWVPSSPTEAFEKGLEIRTNDPENQSIVLKISGKVVPPVIVAPERVWGLREVVENQPSEMMVLIASPLAKQFSIASIESGSRAVSVTPEAITDPEELAAAGSLSGYRLKIIAQPVGPVGAFSVPVKVRTDLKTKKTGEMIVIDALVTGHRRGPIRIRGLEWAETYSSVSLGQFDSKVGKTVTLSLMAKDEPSEGLQFTEIVCDPDFMKVKLERDESYQQAPRRYHLTIEYPPGSPRAYRRDVNPGRIKIKSNHPAAPEINLQVFLNAF